MSKTMTAIFVVFAAIGQLGAQHDEAQHNDGQESWERNKNELVAAAMIEISQNSQRLNEIGTTLNGEATSKDHALGELAVLALANDDVKSFRRIAALIQSAEVKANTYSSASEQLLEFGNLEDSIETIEEISDRMVRSEAFLKFCYVAGANSTSGLMLALDSLENCQPQLGAEFDQPAGFGEGKLEKKVTPVEIEKYRDQAFVNLCMGLIRVDDLNNVEGLIDSISSDVLKDHCRFAAIFKDSLADQPNPKVQSFLKLLVSNKSQARLLQWLTLVRKSRFEDAIKFSKQWTPVQESTLWNEIWRVANENSNLKYQKLAATRLFELFCDNPDDTLFDGSDSFWDWEQKPKLAFVANIHETDTIFGIDRLPSAKELLQQLVAAKLTSDGSEYFELINDQKLRLHWVQAMIEFQLAKSNWEQATAFIAHHAKEFPKIVLDDSTSVFARAAIGNSNWTDALKFTEKIQNADTRLRFRAIIIGSKENSDSDANRQFIEKMLEECWEKEKKQCLRPVKLRLEFLIDEAAQLGWPPAVTQTNPLLPFLEKEFESTKNYERAASHLHTILGSFTPVSDPTRSQFFQLYLKVIDQQLNTNGTIPAVAKKLGLDTTYWGVHRYQSFSHDAAPEIELNLDELDQIMVQLETAGFFERADSGMQSWIIGRFATVACRQGHVELGLKMIKKHPDEIARISMILDCINDLPNSPQPEFDLPATFGSFGNQTNSGGLF